VEKSTCRDASGMKEWLIVGLFMAAGLALRLDFLLAGNFIIDADEAIVGLMAKHIAEGKPIPVFYYGQHYMGSFEPLLVSLLFRIFGISNLCLKSVPLAFSLMLIPLMYALGRELLGTYAGRAAALLTAIPPATLVVWSAKARGGFIELVFIGALAMLLCVRWLKQKDAPLSGVILMGLVLGFGWWVNNQIAFFMLAIGIAVLSRLLFLPAFGIVEKFFLILYSLLAGGAAFLIGGLPFWIYNIQHHFASFGMFQRSSKTDIAEHVQGFFSTSLPIIFGAKRFWEAENIFPGSTVLAYSMYSLALFIVLVFQRKNLLNLLRLKVNANDPLLLFPLFLVGTGAIFCISSFGHLVQAPRYLLPAYVGLFILTAAALHYLRSTVRTAAPLLLCGFLGFHLASSYAGGRALPGEPIVYQWDRVAKNHSELIHWLHEHHYSWVRTNYWIGYRLAFETEEALRFLVFQEPHQTRIESYRTEGKQAGPESMPLVLVHSQTPMVETALTALGYTFAATQLSGYDVLYEIQPSQSGLKPLPSSEFRLTSSENDATAALAADNDTGTRWGSGEPQRPGMQFSAVFTEPQTIRGIQLDTENWETDFPRGLRIEAELESGERKVLFNETSYHAALYYLNHSPVFSLVFPPIRATKLILTETGSDPVFDWSIAELEIER
jgi:hypothetical protein